MKRLALLLLPLAGIAWGQYSPSQSGSTVAAAEINSKPAVQNGSTSPSGNCTTGKDLWINTISGVISPCTSTNNWTTPAFLINPMTTNGDVIVGSTSGSPQRAACTSGVLKGGTPASCASLVAADIPTALGSTTSVNGTSIPASGTLTQTIGSGTAALGTSSIGSGACASAVTVSATGVATTDAIQFTPNADITAVTGYAPSTSGGVAIYPYPTANNVNFKVCNPTSASITPGAVTLNWRVVR